MKLVANEDMSALNEDAGQILTLNERLSRYALYVSQMERSNRDMGTQLEKGRSSTTVSTKLAEKVSVGLVTAWRALGFNGIPGSEIMTMQLP